MGQAFRLVPQRKLHPGIDAQNGTYFPFEPLAETVSRNTASEWDALSGWSFKRKVRPGIRARNGMRFPSAGRLESASQFEHSFRDAVSAEGLNRKVCPTLRRDSGSRFPPGMPFGKRVPAWQTGGHKFFGPYNSTLLSHFGRMVWRIPAVCSFFASMPAERTSFMVKRMSGWP